MERNKYLEIYPSEVAANKINSNLDKMLEQNPKIYRKTLIRYEKLAMLLLGCVEKIIKILQSETLLSSENSEFQELASDHVQELHSAIASVNTQFNTLSNLNTGSSDTSEINKSSNKKILFQYGRVLSIGNRTNFGYTEVNECASLICRWYTCRFAGNNPNFKYQLRQLPIWISYIIVAYGKYLSEGTQHKDVFITNFTSWCDSLELDLNNCWALPTDVFSMIKNIKPQDYTLQSVVINDILTECCYYQLGELDSEFKYDTSTLVTIVRNNNPALNPFIRVRLSKQLEFIKDLELTPCTEINEL